MLIEQTEVGLQPGISRRFSSFDGQRFGEFGVYLKFSNNLSKFFSRDHTVNLSRGKIKIFFSLIVQGRLITALNS